MTRASDLVRSPASLERIEQVSIGPAHVIRARYADGAEIEADLGEFVARSRLLAPLRDPALFAQARLIDRGAGLEWPGGIDYSAGALRRLAEAQGRDADEDVRDPRRSAEPVVA